MSTIQTRWLTVTAVLISVGTLVPTTLDARESGKADRDDARIKPTVRSEPVITSPLASGDSTRVIDSADDSGVRPGDKSSTESGFELATAGSASAIEMNWQVLSTGATSVSTTAVVLQATFGQAAVGFGAGNAVQLSSGFWQSFGVNVVLCCGVYDPFGLTGNLDQDEQNFKDITDILLLARYAFFGGPQPICLADANTDGDPECQTDISDILRLSRYALLGGAAPAECLAECEQIAFVR
jgi:hypothetical protein